METKKTSNTSYYFSHDYNSRNDPKLQTVMMKMGMEGIGIFWCLVEIMYEQGGRLKLEECDRYAFSIRSTKEKVKEVVGLSFSKNEKMFWSNSVIERLKKREEKSKKAKKSASYRWDKTKALRSQSDSNTIKERKGKERKGNKGKYSSLKDIKKSDIQTMASDYGTPVSFVERKLEDMTDYCQDHGKRYKNYLAALRNFVRKDASSFYVKPKVQPKRKETKEEKAMTPAQMKKARDKVEAIKKKHNFLRKK